MKFVKKKNVTVALLSTSYNFCHVSFVSGGYFATEENEEKREIREKI